MNVDARRPSTAGRASTNCSNTSESCLLAAVTQDITGMRRASVTMWRLLPSFPRSAGLGPACAPLHAESAEVQPVALAQFVEQLQGQLVPHACRLPIAQSPPACHAAAKAQFLG